ncbi:DNA (cytosine-5-)-methyltransferase [Candidatus Marinimicrobia bacterium]|nr:DNA (cytosine-5-)-methyltransferase [Candidatus Neomarinimicrobiota bacterium]
MKNKSSKLTVGGLFSGIGGLELAFQNEGFKVAWANDIDKYTHQVYQRVVGSDHYIGNKPISLEYINEHFNEFDIQPVDVLTAGFPCQPFSLAGNRQGFKDQKGRGNCFNLIMDFLDNFEENLQPKILLFENVKNIKNHDNGNTLKTINNLLIKKGYFSRLYNLNTSKLTKIPQNRERAFIVCSKDDIMSDSHAYFKFLQESKNSPDSFKTFLDSVNDEKYFSINNYLKKHKIVFNDASEDEVYQLRRVYLRQNMKQQVPTLVASMGQGGHNVPLIYTKGRYRRLTPKECFRFQGFNNVELDGLSDTQLYKMSGNSVTLPLIQLIAKEINKYL